MIRVRCPHCQKPCALPDGTTSNVRCPGCKGVFAPQAPVAKVAVQEPPKAPEESAVASGFLRHHLVPVVGLTCLLGGLLLGSLIGYALGSSRSIVVQPSQGQTGVHADPTPNRPVEKAQPAMEPVLQVTAQNLFRDHVIDLAKATATYQGKVLEIALPSEIQVDSAGRRFLASEPQRLVKSEPRGGERHSVGGVRGALQQEAMNATYLPGIWAFIRDRNAFAGVGPGKPCTVRGRYQGTIQDNKTSPEFVIILEDCERVRP